jgi:hypothetical protein
MHRYEFVFELLPLEPGRKLLNDEHLIRVHLIKEERIINGERIIDVKRLVNGKAIATVAKSDDMGFFLYGIRLNGVSYLAEYKTILYWFPSYPQTHVDGSLRVYLARENGSETVLLEPLDALSFMDASGTFVYQYKMVSKNVKVMWYDGSCKEELVFKELNTPVTLYQTDNKFTLMVDNKTMKEHPIKKVVTYYQMPVYT